MKERRGGKRKGSEGRVEKSERRGEQRGRGTGGKMNVSEGGLKAETVKRKRVER